MADESPEPQPDALPDDGRIEVRSYFVRERNALLVRSRFGGLYMDYYLHLMQHAITHQAADDLVLKDALAALTLHLTSKPWHDKTAWTISLQKPALNVFVTGDSCAESITGRVFTDHIKEHDTGLFYSQVINAREPLRQSTVEIEGREIFRAVEQFYAQSEQRPARLFEFEEEDFVMISAQPECDTAWLEALDNDAVREIDQKEELSLLEKRHFRFDCGCDLERIYRAIAPIARRDVDDFFRGDDSLKVDCPRCAAHFEVTRSGFEAFLESI